MRRRWATLLVALCVLGHGIPAAAQAGTAGLSVEAEAGLGGHFKFGEWLSVWVELQNRAADRTVEVQVRVVGTWGGTTFAAPVSLPTGSRKRVPVYVLPNSYSRALEVQVIEGGELLLQREVTVQSHLNTDLLVGIVAPERGALTLVSSAELKGVERKVVLIDLALGDLPDRSEALQSLDCVIINDMDTSSLTLGQRAALETWVRHGGRLVLGGGAGAARVASGISRNLLPLDPGRLVELEALPGLEQYVAGEPVRVPGPFVAAAGEPASGRTLAAQDGLALVQELNVGQGYVDAVALDLAASPFDAWAGAIPFWEQLVLAGAAYASGLPPDMSARQMASGQMSYALSNLPSLALPSVKWLALLLGVYVVLVGPANYALLRWRGKLQWAWVTIPVITVLFSSGAFGIGYAMRGTDLILNKVAIVAMQLEGPARVDTYVGLFSPTQRSYEIEVDGGGLLSPLNPDADPFSASGFGGRSETVFVQGRPARVRGLSVNQWSMQTFMSEDVWSEAGRIEAEIELRGEELVGTVRNATPYPLRDVVVVLGTQFVRVGDLNVGAEASVRLDLSARMANAFGPPLGYRLFEEQLREVGPGGPPREVQFKQTVLDSVLMYGGKFSASSRWPGASTLGEEADGPYVLGWFGEAPPEVLVGGRRPAVQTMALLLAPIAYRFAPGKELVVPPGLISGAVTQMPAEGGSCGPPGTAAVYVARGDAVFEFRVPPEMDVELRKLIVEIGSEGGWAAPPDLAVYDWGSGEWSAIEDAVLGRNILAEVESLVSADGIVRVQLSSTGMRSGCYYVDLGLEGAR
jgi:hypothetical protein